MIIRVTVVVFLFVKVSSQNDDKNKSMSSNNFLDEVQQFPAFRKGFDKWQDRKKTDETQNCSTLGPASFDKWHQCQEKAVVSCMKAVTRCLCGKGVAPTSRNALLPPPQACPKFECLTNAYITTNIVNETQEFERTYHFMDITVKNRKKEENTLNVNVKAAESFYRPVHSQKEDQHEQVLRNVQEQLKADGMSPYDFVRKLIENTNFLQEYLNRFRDMCKRIEMCLEDKVAPDFYDQLSAKKDDILYGVNILLHAQNRNPIKWTLNAK